MINLSNKQEIKQEIESFNNAAFIKFQTIRDREGIFRHVHFAASEFALEGIEKEFGKEAMRTTKKNKYILEFKRQGLQWV
jgi:hypothetical protein